MKIIALIISVMCSLGVYAQDSAALDIRVKKARDTSADKIHLVTLNTDTSTILTGNKIQLNSSAKETVSISAINLSEGDYFTVMLKKEYGVFSMFMITIGGGNIKKEILTGYTHGSSVQRITTAMQNKAKVFLEDFVLIDQQTLQRVPFKKTVELVP